MKIFNQLVILLAVFCLARPVCGQTVLGKNPSDRVLTNLFNGTNPSGQMNADAIVDAINHRATQQITNLPPSTGLTPTQVTNGFAGSTNGAVDNLTLNDTTTNNGTIQGGVVNAASLSDGFSVITNGTALLYGARIYNFGTHPATLVFSNGVASGVLAMDTSGSFYFSGISHVTSATNDDLGNKISTLYSPFTTNVVTKVSGGGATLSTNGDGSGVTINLPASYVAPQNTVLSNSANSIVKNDGTGTAALTNTVQAAIPTNTMTVLAATNANFAVTATNLAGYNFLFGTNSVATNTYTTYYGADQGCYNDGTNEFFNDTFNLWFPSGANLSGSNTVLITINGSTNYNGFAYDHLGDADFYNGKVYVPLFNSNPTNNAIGVFTINYATSNFSLVSVTRVANDQPVNSGTGISAVAVDAPRGLIYALDYASGSVAYTNIAAYALSDFHFVKYITMSVSVQQIQGAKMVGGVLELLSDLSADGTQTNANIWAVSPDTGNTIFLEKIQGNFPGIEVEGLDAFGTNLIVQGITSQYGTDLTYYPITNSIVLDAAGNLNNAQLLGTTVNNGTLQNNGTIQGGVVNAASLSDGFSVITNGTALLYGARIYNFGTHPATLVFSNGVASGVLAMDTSGNFYFSGISHVTSATNDDLGNKISTTYLKSSTTNTATVFGATNLVSLAGLPSGNLPSGVKSSAGNALLDTASSIPLTSITTNGLPVAPIAGQIATFTSTGLLQPSNTPAGYTDAQARAAVSSPTNNITVSNIVANGSISGLNNMTNINGSTLAPTLNPSVTNEVSYGVSITPSNAAPVANSFGSLTNGGWAVVALTNSTGGVLADVSMTNNIVKTNLLLDTGGNVTVGGSIQSANFTGTSTKYLFAGANTYGLAYGNNEAQLYGNNSYGLFYIGSSSGYQIPGYSSREIGIVTNQIFGFFQGTGNSSTEVPFVTFSQSITETNVVILNSFTNGFGTLRLQDVQARTGEFTNSIAAPTNTAAYATPATTIVPATAWTNTFNGRASIEIIPVSTDAIGGLCSVNFKRGTIGGVTNDNWTVNYFAGLTAGAFTMTNQPWVIPDIGTNEWFLFTDTSSGGGSWTISTNRLHIK